MSGYDRVRVLDLISILSGTGSDNLDSVELVGPSIMNDLLPAFLWISFLECALLVSVLCKRECPTAVLLSMLLF